MIMRYFSFTVVLFVWNRYIKSKETRYVQKLTIVQRTFMGGMHNIL